jgi:hypothetical protein
MIQKAYFSAKENEKQTMMEFFLLLVGKWKPQMTG